MKSRFAVLATAALLGTVLALPASAQFAKPEDAIKYRQSALSVMAAHWGRIAATVNGRVPFDAKATQDNADVVATLARLPWQGFGPGTEGGKAKASVWSDHAKFRGNADKFAADMERLNAAAKTGNLDQIKAVFGSVSANCKACHDDFRQ